MQPCRALQRRCHCHPCSREAVLAEDSTHVPPCPRTPGIAEGSGTMKSWKWRRREECSYTWWLRWLSTSHKIWGLLCMGVFLTFAMLFAFDCVLPWKPLWKSRLIKELLWPGRIRPVQPPVQEVHPCSCSCSLALGSTTLDTSVTHTRRVLPALRPGQDEGWDTCPGNFPKSPTSLLGASPLRGSWCSSAIPNRKEGSGDQGTRRKSRRKERGN